MPLAEPISLAALFSKEINLKSSSLCLFAYEGEGGLPIQEYLQSVAPSTKQEMSEIWLFIGSEGGFSTAEVEDFKRRGLQPVTLGPQVLRVETACLALVPILKYEFGTMR